MDFLGARPPWHDDITGEMLVEGEVYKGMEKERECLKRFAFEARFRGPRLNGEGPP